MAKKRPKHKLPPVLKKHQFQKGQSGNPLGGKLHDPERRILRDLSVDTFREVIKVVLTNDIQGLKSMIVETGVSALQVGIATAFLNAIKSGDYAVIERIAERIVGKIPDELNINSKNINANLNATIDKAKLKAAYDELEEDV